ncbi:hypothetical protein LX36DRAFT_712958 [Colletotrichum falcatum]|nr:hypothetical protein LX36DRAFT_712958 [Colletotrichum falcatum]
MALPLTFTYRGWLVCTRNQFGDIQCKCSTRLAYATSASTLYVGEVSSTTDTVYGPGRDGKLYLLGADDTAAGYTAPLEQPA